MLSAIWMLAAVWPGTSDARAQESAVIPHAPQVTVATPQALTDLGPLTPAEIQLYKRAQTLIDWTPHQVHECPFLHKVQAAGGSEQLAAILKQVAQTNALLLQNFPQVSCDEKVSSEIAMVPGGWQVRSRSLAVVRNFHYIVTPVFESGLPGFDEYRTDLNGRPATLTGLFMITSNFVSTGLYLSAADQPDSHFRLFGTEKARNRNCYLVGFAQDPERTHTGTRFHSKGASAILLVQGLVWIDSETFQILRVSTWLLAPRDDVQLTSEASTVDFDPVQPSGSDRTLWLPRDVSVEGMYRGIAFHNAHHYSNFKLFRVESTIKPGR